MLANYSWTWGFPWSVVDIPIDTSLEKYWFCSPSRYQLQIDSRLQVGVCVHFPFLVLGFCLFEPVCAVTVSVWTSALLCLEDVVFREASTTSDFYNLSTLSSTLICKHRVEGLSSPKWFSVHCPVVGLHANYQIVQETSLMIAELSYVLLINLPLGIILLVCSFHIIIVVDFPLGLENGI